MRRFFLLGCLALGCLLLGGCGREAPGQAGGGDPYAWMGDPAQDEALRRHIEREKARYRQWMARHGALRARLVREFGERLPDKLRGPAITVGGHDYWREHRAGHQYPFFMRRRGQAAELLLDANQLAQGGYLDLKTLDVSADGGSLLFTADLTGDESYGLWLKRLEASGALRQLAEGTTGSAAFDGACVCFVKRQSGQDSLYRLCPDAGAAALVHQEADPAFRLAVHRSGEATVLRSESPASNQLWLVQDGRLAEAAPRLQGVQSRLVARQGVLYLLTNRGGKGDRLWKGQLGSLAPAPLPVAGRILDFEVGAGYVAALTRERMRYAITVADLDGALTRRIAIPKGQARLQAGSREGLLRFATASLVSPRVEHEVAPKGADLVIQPAISADYIQERLWFSARDGAQVPVTLAYRKGQTPVSGQAPRPLLVSAYGAYGVSADLGHDPKRLSLLDRGLVYAVVHVRGGGDLGPAWHEAAKGRRKGRSAEDLADGIRFLLRQGYGAPGRVVLRGKSAGGTLAALVASRHPEWLAALVAREPFVDLLSALRQGSPADWDEWGNPALPEDKASLAALSPYQNVRRQAWPAVFATGAYLDARVHVSQPLKWVARLRDHQAGSAPILVDIAMQAGHQGPSDRQEAQQSVADEYAFILVALGLTE